MASRSTIRARTALCRPDLATRPAVGAHRQNNKDTWEFSDNQRLCTLDWLTWPEGYGKDWSRIHWDSWVPQINLADQNVALKAGGTEKRYRVATRVSYDEPRSRVLHRLLQAGDQQLYTTADGLIGSRGGVWTTRRSRSMPSVFPKRFSRTAFR